MPWCRNRCRHSYFSYYRPQGAECCRHSITDVAVSEMLQTYLFNRCVGNTTDILSQMSVSETINILSQTSKCQKCYRHILSQMSKCRKHHRHSTTDVGVSGGRRQRCRTSEEIIITKRNRFVVGTASRALPCPIPLSGCGEGEGIRDGE